MPAYMEAMQLHWYCQTPFDPSCSRSLPAHIRVVYMSLECNVNVNVILWPCAFSTYLWRHISSCNCWVTEKQYWPLHYRTARLTGHWPLCSRSLWSDWPYLPRSSGVSHPESMRTLQDLLWVPYSKVAWPRQTAYITGIDCRLSTSTDASLISR